MVRCVAASFAKGNVMKFKIHFTWPDGTDDSFTVAGDDLDDLIREAHQGVADRNGENPWSEEMPD